MRIIGILAGLTPKETRGSKVLDIKIRTSFDGEQLAMLGHLFGEGVVVEIQSPQSVLDFGGEEVGG